MTDDPADTAGTEGERLFPLVEGGLVNGVLNVLRDMSRHPAPGDEPGPDGQAMSGADLSAMRSGILKEVLRHDARVFDTKGQGDAAPVDLDDIRVSIGRRLDRIRDARGAG